MRKQYFLILILLLIAGDVLGAPLVSFLTTGKYNRVINADRWCAGSDWDGDNNCNNCMNEQWAEPYAPWMDDTSQYFEDDGPLCNTLDPLAELLVFRTNVGDWTKFGLFFTSVEQLTSAINQCSLNYNNSDHMDYGYDCEGDYGEFRGTFIGGFGFEIGAVLRPRIDPRQGPPMGDEVYPFFMDFADLQSNLTMMISDPLYSGWTPWRIVFSASLHDWQESQSEQALWNMAHSLSCWQSSLSGWENGRDIIDVMPVGYPEWSFDWTVQPTYLFYLYSAVSSYLEVAVPARTTNWGSLKAMYHGLPSGKENR